MLKAKGQTQESNLITNLSGVPSDLTYGSLTYTESMDGGATISITYKGILEKDIQSHYRLWQEVHGGKTIKASILNTDVVVTNVSIVESVDAFFRYDVTIQYQSDYLTKYSRQINIYRQGKKTYNAAEVAAAAGLQYTGASLTIPLKTDSNSREFLVSPEEVIQKSAYAKGQLIVKQKNSIKTIFINTFIPASSSTRIINTPTISAGVYDFIKGELILTASKQEEEEQVVANPYVEVPPKIETNVESDPNPQSPPDGSIIIKTIDNNSIDGSGPKKTWRETTTVGGKIIKEVIEIYGFNYTSADLDLEDGTSASSLWDMIERQVTTYRYDIVAGMIFEVFGQIPGGIGELDLIIHPDYVDLVDYSALGNELRLNLSTKYLTEVITEGWQYNRFQQESVKSLEATYADPTESELYKFRKIQKKGKVAYHLRSQRDLVKSDAIPFSVEWIKYADASPKIQAMAGFSEVGNGYVGILTPDPNYVEPMAIMESYDVQQSFDKIKSPYITQDKDGNEIIAYLVKGEETKNEVLRSVIDQNKYREKIREYSAKNGGFEDLVEKEYFREVSGALPQAEYQSKTFEQANSTSDNQELVPKTKRYRLVIGNDDDPDSKLLSSLSVPDFIEDIDTAIKYLETELIARSLDVSTKQVSYAWYDPSIQVGDLGSLGFGSLGGNWIVKSHSVTFNFNGTNNITRRLLITSDGHEVTYGAIPDFKISFSQLDSNEDLELGQPTLKVNVKGGEVELASFGSNYNRRAF